jgi:hypothetical protein
MYGQSSQSGGRQIYICAPSVLGHNIYTSGPFKARVDSLLHTQNLQTHTTTEIEKQGDKEAESQSDGETEK